MPAILTGKHIRLLLPVRENMMRRIQQFQPPAEILQPNAGTALVLSVVFREVAVADRADDPCPFLVNLQVDKRGLVVAHPMLESILDQEMKRRGATWVSDVADDMSVVSFTCSGRRIRISST